MAQSDEAANIVEKAIGSGEPKDQITYNLIIATAAYLSSSVGLVFMIGVALFATVMILIGILRLSDTFDSMWPLS